MAKTKNSAGSSPVFRRYTAIRQECYNPRCKEYPRVGARGIRCFWDNSRDFTDYVLRHLGLPPQGALSKLTRIDLDRNFEPGNLEWSTAERIANRPEYCVSFTYRRSTRSLMDWCRHFDIRFTVAYGRYQRGWTFRQIFITQTKK